ncbi:MAG TPA: AAA family ATPase [Dermatophilaceae bacterium]|nr:AAA family ATPase [Dermatophilaceae bacterium]HPZ67484.1 AAA family ATPase [Dermatophilaceae bacterium]
MRDSVYTPGAGHQPPVLAGRSELLRNWDLMLNDATARGRVRARDIILVGPRGVGKTAALSAIATRSARQGIEVVGLQAVVGQAGLVESLLDRARALAEAGEGPWRRARHALERIAAVNMSVAGFGAGISTRETGATPRLDAGTLAAALATVAEEVRKDAPTGGLLITVDEMQVAAPADLAIIAAALHRLNVDHPSAVVVFAGTGLPMTPDRLRQAGVTHPDRLFQLEDIPLALSPEDTRYAITEPAREHGVTWDPGALDQLARLTNGYPAHVQLFADAAWSAATGPDRITLHDVDASLPDVTAMLTRRTLGPRWDRITDRQMEFAAAVALLGGDVPIATVATALGKKQGEISWIRDDLIKEGDLYSPRRGYIALTVPLFADFILARYSQDQQGRATALLTLEQMSANVDAKPSPGTPVTPPPSPRALPATEEPQP